MLVALVATATTQGRAPSRGARPRAHAAPTARDRLRPPFALVQPPASVAVPLSARTPFAACRVTRDVAPDAEVEPSLAADAADPSRLIAVWQQDRDFRGGARGPVSAWTADGGRTWTRVVVPNVTACSGDSTYILASDPVVSVGPGRAYLASLAIRPDGKTDDVLVSTSVDGGRTWGDPVLVRAGNVLTGDPDKEFVLADPRNAGTAYAVWVEFPRQRSGRETTDSTLFSRTTDGGRTWSPALVSYAAHTETQFHQLGVLPDGTLVAAFAEILRPVRRRHLPVQERLAVMRSVDGGARWSAPRTIARFNLTAATDPATHRAIRADSIDFGFTIAPDGRVYVTWVEDPAEGASQVLVARSDDGGTTWSSPVAVTVAGQAVFLPAIAAAGDGTMGVTWYGFEPSRPDSKLRTDVWFASSIDGGLTWRTQHVAGPFDMHTAKLSDRGDFVGDYQGLVGLPTSFGALFAMARPLAVTGPTDVFFAPLRSRP